MTDSITIQRATTYSPQLAQAIRHLAKQEGDHYQELTEDDVTEMITGQHHYLLVAIDTQKNRYVGMIFLLIFRIPYLRKAYIDDLVVDSAYRGQGIGTQLMTHAATVAKAAGAAYADFTSQPQREANNLYTKLGFQKRDTNVYRVHFTYGKR